jgi:exopolysaccharide production protein ExoY
MSSDPLAQLLSPIDTPRGDGIVWDLSLTRVLDIFLSLIALLILTPLMTFIALAIRMEDGGPVLYAHRRVGYGGCAFPCYKFRSMVSNSAERLEQLLASDPAARREWDRDFKLKNDPRITALGSFLRKSSLDELPQLFNVLMGHMSLVGPRPIVADEVRRYGRYFSAYCAQRPGVTGLWQISGRNDTTYRRRVAIDVVFSRAKCLRLYVYILVMTPAAVLGSRGSY